MHTVDSPKLALELQKRVAQLRPDRPLDVLVQVNTSAEASKSGCEPAGAVALCAQVVSECPLLRLRGLMYSASEGSALEDFEVLKRGRELAARKSA